MGTIVTLPAERPRRRAAARTTSEATILLFMGVRYVRDREPAVGVDLTQPIARAHDGSPLAIA